MPVRVDELVQVNRNDLEILKVTLEKLKIYARGVCVKDSSLRVWDEDDDRALDVARGIL